MKEKVKKMLERVAQDIQSHGWQALGVSGKGSPDFAYTIGLTESYDHPEIIMSGLKTPLMQALLNDIGALVKEGQVFEDGQMVRDIIKGYPVKFVRLSEKEVDEYLMLARIYYNKSIDALQCQWPDKNGRFPSEDGCSEDTIRQQGLAI